MRVEASIPLPSLRRVGRCSLAVLVTCVTLACGNWGSQRPLVVAFDDHPVTLDPHFHNHSVTWSVLSNFYDPLVGLSPEVQLEPALAVSWEKLDERQWRLRLRPGVRFHDGRRLGAEDVVASFDRAHSHPRSLVRHYLVGVESMHSAGEHAVLVTTSAPAPDLLNRLASLYVVPRGDAGEEEITHPIGSGPYRFGGGNTRDGVSAVAWESWRGKPEVAEVRFLFFDDNEASAAELLEGRADVARGLPDRMVSEVEKIPGLRLVPQPGLAVGMLAIAPHAADGPAASALADARVRKALLLALDRAGWIRRVFRGNGTVASQYVHPVVFGYDPTVPAVPHDPQAARRLLAEAGYPEGFAVGLGHGFVRSGVIEAIVEDLADIGVRVTPRAVAFEEALRLARAGEIAIFYYGWACTTGDASEFLNTSVHSWDEDRGLGLENYAQFADPALDALLERADRELDAAQRLALLQEAQRRVLQELPVLPLTIRWGFLGVSSRVDVLTRHDQRIWVAAYRWRG